MGKLNIMAQAKPQTQSRLKNREEKSFFGRQFELETLLEVLTPDGPLVSHIHGIAGLGKSSLLAQFAKQATGRGAVVTMMDCRLVEPTAGGFLEQWGQLTETVHPDATSAARAVLKSGKVQVLCLDHY